MSKVMLILIRVLVFILCCAFSALICWLGGYDFNYRGLDVASYAVCIVVFSGCAAAYPFHSHA